MTKQLLIDALATAADIPRTKASLGVDAIIEAITSGLASKDREFRLPGLGTFSAKPTPARTGTNPRTGEPVAIRPGHRFLFRASAQLKGAMPVEEKPKRKRAA